MSADTFKSCATWPKGTFDAIGNYSEDTHESRESAEAVCSMLHQNGAGGDGKAFPIRTWVELVGTATTSELQARLTNLLAVDAQEVGGRASDVAGLIEEILSLRKERDGAVQFSNKVERGEVSFAKKCDEQLAIIATLPLGKTLNENLSDAVRRVLGERDRLKTIVESADPFYTIMSPAFPDEQIPATLIHTHLSCDEKEAIESFMHTEGTMHEIANMGRAARGEAPQCAESWEVWEAKGYRVVECFLMEAQPSPPSPAHP